MCAAGFSDPKKVMLGSWSTGLQYFVWAIVVLTAIGYFIRWARTRFWLPKYVHVLAVLSALVGAWSVWISPETSRDPVGNLWVVLIFPAMVYLFFVFYGGQAASERKRKATVVSARELADLIERLLNGTSGDSEEWLDFVGTERPDSLLEPYRRRCAELSLQVIPPNPQDPAAVAELRNMVGELRRLPDAMGRG